MADGVEQEQVQAKTGARFACRQVPIYEMTPDPTVRTVMTAEPIETGSGIAYPTGCA